MHRPAPVGAVPHLQHGFDLRALMFDAPGLWRAVLAMRQGASPPWARARSSGDLTDVKTLEFAGALVPCLECASSAMHPP